MPTTPDGNALLLGPTTRAAARIFGDLSEHSVALTYEGFDSMHDDDLPGVVCLVADPAAEPALARLAVLPRTGRAPGPDVVVGLDPGTSGAGQVLDQVAALPGLRLESVVRESRGRVLLHLGADDAGATAPQVLATELDDWTRRGSGIRPAVTPALAPTPAPAPEPAPSTLDTGAPHGLWRTRLTLGAAVALSGGVVLVLLAAQLGLPGLVAVGALGVLAVVGTVTTLLVLWRVGHQQRLREATGPTGGLSEADRRLLMELREVQTALVESQTATDRRVLALARLLARQQATRERPPSGF